MEGGEVPVEGVVGEEELREGEVEGEVVKVGGGERPGQVGRRMGVVRGEERRGGGGGRGREGGEGGLDLEEESVGFSPGGGHEGGREGAHVF